jgi:tetratricopeptide (TPR) repeat protein
VAGVDDGVRARARLLYDQGAKAYREGRYHVAAESFLDSHRLYPTPQLLYNVAIAFDKLGVEPSALAHYRDYLRRLPSASDAEEVKARINELEASLAKRGVQQITVMTEPSQALLVIDGTAVGVTPWTGETWPGAHHIAITHTGQQPIAPVITVQAIRAEDFSFKLEPVPPPEAKPAAPPPPPPPREVSTLTWIVLGVGTAALGTTLVSEMAAKNSTGLTRTGAFFGGVGLTASLLGGVFLHLDLHEPDATPLRKAHGVTASATGQF